MKTVNIIFEEKEKVSLVESEVQSPQAHEILCAAQKSLLSTGTETLCLRGVFDSRTGWDNWVKYPFRPGYSMSAKVIAVGESVEGIKPGNRVAVPYPHCRYFIVNAQNAYVLPDFIDDEQAMWMALACTTQLGVRRANLELGENVGVIGLGLLGQLVVQYLKVAGARHIYCIDPSQERLDFASKNGATHTLPMNAQDAIEEVGRMTNGKKLDVVFDITGHPSVLAPATQLVRKLGRVILLGDSTTPSQQVLGPRVVADSVSILGIHGNMFPKEETVFNPWTRKEMTSLFFDYLQQGRMNVSDLITHRFSPLEAASVYEGLCKDRSTAMGVIFDWTGLQN